jgi:carbon monoxide dehydrogenase subunit G
MEHSTSLSQHIQAPPEKVWSVITDIPGSAATLSGVESVQLLTDGPYGEGTRWKETRKMFGRAETVEMWVAEAELEPQHHGQGGAGRSGLHHPVQPGPAGRRH